MKVSDKGGTDFEPIPADTHPARCIRVVDMGTQHWTYKGKEKATRKLRIDFEVPSVTRVFDEDKGEEPAIIGVEFTASINEKANLRKFLESWRGRPFTQEELEGFDVSNLVGAPALIQVVHVNKDGKTYANISTAMQLPKAMKADLPKQITESVMFDLENFNGDAFRKLPEWIQKKIGNSDEFKALHQSDVVGSSLAERSDDDGDADSVIPF